MINRSTTGFGTNIEKDTNVWVKYGTKSVKEPAMRINLLRVLFLKAKQYLNRDNSFISTLEFHFRINRNLGGVFKNVSRNVSVVNFVFGYTILIDTNSSQISQSTLIDLLSTIRYYTYYDFFPPIFTPNTGSITRTKMSYVFYDTMKSAGEKNFIFLYHKDIKVNFIPAIIIIFH